MAKPSAPAAPVESTDAKLETEANDRLAACRAWKDKIILDLKEGYFFAAPHRQRQLSSQTQPSSTPLLDAPELQTGIAFELCGDFVTEIVSAFMPEATPWCERGRGMDLPQGVWENAQVTNMQGQTVTLKDQVKADDKTVFDAMKASNLYPEISKAFYPDLALGTVALWADRPHPHLPIIVSAIPLRELEINLGPYGEIDDRFAVRYTRNCYVRELLPAGITLPLEIAKLCDEKGSDRTEIRWGYWRLWDRKDDECWQHVILVKDKIVHNVVLQGEGSCPLIVARFNPSSDWPFGIGPLIQGLPDLRQIDELEARKVEGVSRAINPPIGYPDDSFVAVEQGIEDGMAYPVRPGSENAIKPIYPQVNFEPAIMQHEDMEHRLKRLFYVDFPEQSGDTPPTLGQWLDEMARAQRRIGTPGLPFWREGPAKIFLRFKYLLEAAGTILPLKVDGRAIALTPYNPAQAAAEQQEVGTFVKFVQITGQTFPEEFKANIDGRATMEKVAEKMRVTGLVVFRDKDQVKAAVAQMAQLVAGRHAPNATDASAQPPGPPQ